MFVRILHAGIGCTGLATVCNRLLVTNPDKLLDISAALIAGLVVSLSFLLDAVMHHRFASDLEDQIGITFVHVCVSLGAVVTGLSHADGSALGIYLLAMEGGALVMALWRGFGLYKVVMQS